MKKLIEIGRNLVENWLFDGGKWVYPLKCIVLFNFKDILTFIKADFKQTNRSKIRHCSWHLTWNRLLIQTVTFTFLSCPR